MTWTAALLVLLPLLCTAAKESRITNGIAATAGGNPNIVWQARLTIDGRFLCGGSILSSDTIITAGHCVRTLGTTTASDVTFSPRSVLICLGTDANNCALTALGDFMFIHPSFEGSIPFASRVDMAVIRTQSSMVFPANVGPIPLVAPTCTSCEAPLARYIVSGFGNQNADTGGSSNPSSRLLYVQQQFVTKTTCQAPPTAFTLPATAVCTGPIPGETGTDSCQGDSGGPLAFIDTSSGSTVYQLAGVVDTGTASTGGNLPICGGTGTYGIYGSVRANHAWITSTLTASNTSTTPLAITSGAGKDATLPSSGIAWYIIAAPIIGVVLIIIIIIICCCCCCGNRDARRHHHNVRKAAAPVRMVPAAGAPRPVSPRPGGAAPVYTTAPGPPPGYTPATNRPPVRPEYAVPANVAYGHPAMDPAVAYAPPPPAAANYNYPPPAPMAPMPAVYTPAPIVYTPNNYGRM